MKRVGLIVLGVLILGIGALYFYMRAEAQRDPLVHEASVHLPGWPAGAKPVRAVLISDLHIGSGAMDEARLDRIVGQINAPKPDLVLMAGDYIFGHDPQGAAKFGPGLVAPLSRLHAPLGTVAVLGNHDHWTGEADVRRLLGQAHVVLLENSSVVRGPLLIGGVGDNFTQHDRLGETLEQMQGLPGAKLILTHSPDIAPDLPEGVALLLAGHTHCGQAVFPLYGTMDSVSRYGERYLCGLKQEGSHTVIVTAGLGTSGPALRLNAPPDLWLITLGP